MEAKNPKSIFGQRLDQLMKEHGMNDSDAADIIRMERKAIGRYRYDKASPRLNEVVIMAQYFGVSLDWLAGLTDIRAPIDKFLDRKPEKKPEGRKFYNKAWEG